MTVANDSVAVTPGTGATIATHLVGGKEYQAVVIADADGDVGGNPTYRLIVPPQAVGASKVHADLFNATGSGYRIKILSAFAFVNQDTAVTGTLGIQMSLTRTTAVGTGGTAATTEGTSVTAATISKLDTTMISLPTQITARASPAAGATAGALLGTRFMFTEETNAGTAVASAVGCEFVRTDGVKATVRENQGVRFAQGSVASVGSIGFEITFMLVA